MKFRMLKWVVVIGALFIAGCSSRDFIKPDQVQIDQWVQSHPDLPELDKSCIYDGRFEIGIQVETLHFLLGEPKQLITIKQPWAVQEKWFYKKGNQKVFVIEDKHVVGILEEE